MVLKFEVGVPSGKLKWPPKSCMPSRANMKMNRNSRKSRDKMEDMAFIRAITRFLRDDQYLKSTKNMWSCAKSCLMLLFFKKKVIFQRAKLS